VPDGEHHVGQFHLVAVPGRRGTGDGRGHRIGASADPGQPADQCQRCDPEDPGELGGHHARVAAGRRRVRRAGVRRASRRLAGLVVPAHGVGEVARARPCLVGLPATADDLLMTEALGRGHREPRAQQCGVTTERGTVAAEPLVDSLAQQRVLGAVAAGVVAHQAGARGEVGVLVGGRRRGVGEGGECIAQPGLGPTLRRRQFPVGVDGVVEHELPEVAGHRRAALALRRRRRLGVEQAPDPVAAAAVRGQQHPAERGAGGERAEGGEPVQRLVDVRIRVELAEVGARAALRQQPKQLGGAGGLQLLLDPVEREVADRVVGAALAPPRVRVAGEAPARRPVGVPVQVQQHVDRLAGDEAGGDHRDRPAGGRLGGLVVGGRALEPAAEAVDGDAPHGAFDVLTGVVRRAGAVGVGPAAGALRLRADQLGDRTVAGLPLQVQQAAGPVGGPGRRGGGARLPPRRCLLAARQPLHRPPPSTGSYRRARPTGRPKGHRCGQRTRSGR
jgi:hypothetical protein